MNDKIYKSFYLFLLNLGIVSLVLFVLHKLSLLRVDLIFNESWLFAILIFSFTFCIAVKDKINRSRYLTNRNIETIFEVSPYFFLSILIILAVNQFLKLDFLISRNFHIVVLGIAFGFLAFYRNRDRIENELEDEKKKEEEKERDRANDFEYKFPGINRIWGIRSIVKWMYKEGWGYSLGLIGILLIFITIRLFVVVFYKVSFLDEYLHIFAGINLINNGHLPYFEIGIPYYRGFYVSLAASVIYFIFGKNLLLFKLIPLAFGCFNFFLLKKTCFFIGLNKKFYLVVLFLYSIFPLSIFNHTYLRMFVFYETFALLIIILFFKFKFKKSNIFILILFSLFLLITKELSTLIFVGLIFYYFINILINRKLKINRLFFIVSLFLSFVFFKLVSLPHIIDGRGSNLRINEMFIGHLSTFTILFFLSLLFIIVEKISHKQIIIQGILILGWIFIVIPEEYAVIRGIFYYMPLFLIVAFYSLKSLRFNKFFSTLIISLLILQTIFLGSEIFTREGYEIKGEIDHFHYSEFYKSVLNNCSDRIKIFAIHSPYIGRFYGVEEDYLLYLNQNFLTDNSKVNFDNQSYHFLFGDKKIISTEEQLNKIIENEKVCLISAKEWRHTGPYISKDYFDYLIKNKLIYKEDFGDLIFYTN